MANKFEVCDSRSFLTLLVKASQRSGFKSRSALNFSGFSSHISRVERLRGSYTSNVVIRIIIYKLNIHT